MMKTEGQFENDLKLSLVELQKVRGENLIQFLPLVLDKLILLNVRPPVLNGQSGKVVLPLVLDKLILLNVRLPVLNGQSGKVISLVLHKLISLEGVIPLLI